MYSKSRELYHYSLLQELSAFIFFEVENVRNGFTAHLIIHGILKVQFINYGYSFETLQFFRVKLA